ncbi:MAG TPA: methyltransferase domain-containing protein [Pseudomonadales bacterium]|nr:methyltransferase domain-containing protein [Pseudomonadales bacterium]
MIIAHNNDDIMRHPDAVDYWWRQSLGSDILASEIETIQTHLASSWGEWAMQVSTCPQLPELTHGRIHGSYRLSATAMSSECDITGDATQLPIEADTLQSLVLHHVLDFHRHPHQVLREAARVVAPYGRLTLCNFNRFSPLALKQAVFGFHGRHSLRRLLSQSQMKDWLHLIGFEVERVSYCGFNFPSRRWHSSDGHYARIMGQYLPKLGGIIVVTARKEKRPATLSRAGWRELSSRLQGSTEVGSARDIARRERETH